MPSIQEQWLSRINLTVVLFPQFGFLEILEVKLSSRNNQAISELPSFVSVGRVLIVLLVAEVLRPNLHIEWHKYISKSKTPFERVKCKKLQQIQFTQNDKYLLVVKLKGCKILASFRELALLHSLTNKPSEESIEQRNHAVSQIILAHESSDVNHNSWQQTKWWINCHMFPDLVKFNNSDHMKQYFRRNNFVFCSPVDKGSFGVHQVKLVVQPCEKND